MHKKMMIAALTALVCASAASAFAQGAGGPSPEIEAKFQEFQALKMKLDSVRDKAMSKPDIKKKLDAFKGEVETQMKKADPTVAKDLEEFERQRIEFEKARKAGNDMVAMKLSPTLERLAQKLAVAHSKALKVGGLEKKAEAIESMLRTEMNKIDPEVPKMMARIEKVAAELRAAIPTPPPPNAKTRAPAPPR